MPTLFLYTKEEGIVLDIFLSKLGIPPVHSNMEDFVPGCFNLAKGSKESRILAEKIKQFYYGDKEPSLETQSENHKVRYFENSK